MRKEKMRRIAAAVLAGAGILMVFAQPVMAAAPVGDTHQREPRFIRFGVEQGLSSTINDLTIDHQGYVWVATGDGLARYDGTKFRYWRRIVGDPASLPDNEVTLIHVDSADRLWAATWSALSVLDADHRVPRTIQFHGDAARCGIDITAMTSTPEGVVWLGNYQGDICKISPRGAVLRLHGELGQRSYLGESVPVAMRVLFSGDLLIGADTGLWRIELNDPNSRPVLIHKEKTRGGSVFALSPGTDGAIWVGAESGLFLIGPDGKPQAPPWALPSFSRRAIVVHASEGSYWIGSYYGLYRRHFMSAPDVRNDSGFGVSSGVNSMIEDRYGGIWLGSNSEGLLYMPLGSDDFFSFPRFGVQSGENIVSAEIDNDGVLWAITSDNLYRLDVLLNSADKVYEKNNFLMKDPRYIRLCEDKNISISDSRGVFIYAGVSRKQKITFQYILKSSLHKPETLSCDVKGHFFVSLYGGGIMIYSREGKLINEFSPQETLGEEAEAFIDLRFSPDGSPWYSDGKDLRRWDGKRFVRAPLPAGEYVYSLDFVSPTQLWVARFGSLERYDWDGVALHLRERVTAQEGLPAVEARSVLATSTGNIWLNTVRGLVHYDAKQHRARLFGLRDGLPGLDFTVDVLKRRPNGPAIAISKEGIVMFDPDRPLPPPRASALAVEAIELRRGEDTVPFSRRGNAGLRAVMHPGDRDLRIAVRVMSFADPTMYRYRFRLGGYDPDWVDQGDRGERVFSSLSPGRYVLEIQGANADGVWSSTRRIEILVEAPWWRRWWALVCYAIAIVMLLWWIAYLYRLRLKRRHDYQLITQKREVAEQASQAKSRFLANLGHEVRTPMTGVLGMSELLLSTRLDANQHGQVQSIRRAGEHLLRLVNDALDLARIEAGRLELETVDFGLEAMVEEVAALMRPLADRKGLALRVDVSQGACGGWRGDPTRIRQILLNLLGNAIKFTERGEVSLSIEAAMPHGLCLMVSDTGPGLDAEQQRRLFRRFEQAEGARTASRYGGSGLGLAICQELALAMDGGIELRSAPGEGTCFTVRLPLQRAASPSAHSQYRELDDAQAARDVLLVEDDAIVADVLIGMLQAQGHRVIHAGHALAAMTEIATGRFDIALLDLDLPGMDGLALAQHLRGQGLTMPMIAITARADSGAESEAKAAGFDAFLRKPLTGDTLGDALYDRLASRSAATE
jgi:signal transduction histidine kinase/ligand-binding sensor domain-containing protein/CheY-like chemotaxis protein